MEDVDSLGWHGATESGFHQQKQRLDQKKEEFHQVKPRISTLGTGALVITNPIRTRSRTCSPLGQKNNFKPFSQRPRANPESNPKAKPSRTRSPTCSPPPAQKERLNLSQRLTAPESKPEAEPDADPEADPEPEVPTALPSPSQKQHCFKPFAKRNPKPIPNPKSYTWVRPRNTNTFTSCRL